MRQRVETVSSGGMVLGRYRIVQRLAQGGMGVVYLGRLEGAAGFSKPVVIKKVIPSSQNIEETTARFIREAQILSHLQHQGIVTVLDFGKEVGGHCMVLEYVHGYDLSKWLKYFQITETLMQWEHAVFIMLQVLEALSYSHNFRRSDGALAEVLHRDVSPGNILLDLNGRVRLTDFGIARMAEDEDSQYKTQTGVISGKMTYLAPELLSAKPPSASSDVYACGVVLYQMLTGKSPFAGETASRVMWRVMTEKPTPLSAYRDDLPDSLEGAVLQALEKTLEDRYDTAAAFAEDLRALLPRGEKAIGVEVSKCIVADFTGDLPEKLQLEPLPDREKAWRTGAGMSSAEAHATPQALREQITARPPRVQSERTANEASGNAASAATKPKDSPVVIRVLMGAVLVVGAATLASILQPPAAGPSEERFIVVGERKTTAKATSPKDFSAANKASVSSAEPVVPAPPVAEQKLQAAAVKKRRSAKKAHKESSSAALARQVKKSQGALQNCFRSNTTSIQGQPSLHLSYSLDAAGKVVSVGVKPKSVRATALGQCVLKVARATRFEPQGKPLTFSIPVRARTEKQ